MEIRVGLTTDDLARLLHEKVTLSGAQGLSCKRTRVASDAIKIPPGKTISITSENGSLHVFGASFSLRSREPLRITALGSSQIIINSLKRAKGAKSTTLHYVGTFELRPEDNFVTNSFEH